MESVKRVTLKVGRGLRTAPLVGTTRRVVRGAVARTRPAVRTRRRRIPTIDGYQCLSWIGVVETTFALCPGDSGASLIRLIPTGRPCDCLLKSVPMSQVSESAKKTGTSPAKPNPTAPKYPGVRVTCNGNFLVAEHVETRITEGGVFYPITPSTEGGEIYQGSYARVN